MGILDRLCFLSPSRGPWLVALLGLATALALAGSAGADEVGRDTLRLRIQPGPDAVLGLAGATPMQGRTLHCGMRFFGEHQVGLVGPDGVVVQDAIQDRMIGDLAFGIGIARGAGVYTSIPIVVSQEGVDPMTGDVLRHEAPGDMRAGAHFVPLDPGRHHVGFSIQPGVQIPTGTAAGFFTAGLWQALVELGLEVRVGPLRVLGSAATEIGFARVEEGIELIPRMVYGAGFELRPVPEWSVAATYAGRVHSFDTWDIPMEIRVGTAVRPEGALVIGGFVGFGVRTGPGTPALRAGGEITVPIRAPARANPNTLVGMLQQASSPAPQGEPAADDPEPP